MFLGQVLLLPLAFLLLLDGCVTAPPRPLPPEPRVSRYEALVRLDPSQYPPFLDDLNSPSLARAVLQSYTYYKALPANDLFVLGHDTYTVKHLASSMDDVMSFLRQSPNQQDWTARIASEFAVYQSIGTDEQRSVTFTSYFEPTIPARPAPDEQYKFPLYARPPDLIDVDLSLFGTGNPGARIVGRQKGRALVPYYTRGELEGVHQSRVKGLELAWARDAFDVLDMQIEGSGWLDFGSGNLRRIRYDGDNGKRFRSVGQYLISTGKIPKHKFSRDALRRYLQEHPRERQKILNVNERYIFFRLDTSTAAPYAFGNIQVPLTPGRSIATDPKIFPKGALAWIVVEGPRPLQRFVLNQDEGGAIQGPGRVDIFAGRGEEALSFASHLWNQGKLYFLVKKRS